MKFYFHKTVATHRCAAGGCHTSALTAASATAALGDAKTFLDLFAKAADIIAGSLSLNNAWAFAKSLAGSMARGMVAMWMGTC
mmetsp:Transcript_199/g.266  ORF Transcript_199/g.266 Transcript_199/m.266 type:complete len:83 (+) Transcript_199:313-561(+)